MPDINTTEMTGQLLTLTYSMQHSPSWEANRVAASQEIPHIWRKPKVHYRIHKFQPPVPILNQFDPVRTLTSHLQKIHLNIILPSTPRSPKWSLSLRFPHQNPVYASPLPHTRYMARPSHSSRFYHPHNIEWLGNICQNFSTLNITKKIKLLLPTLWRHVGGLKVWLHSFFTSALDGDNWWPWRSGRFTSKREPQYPLIMRQGACFQKRYISCPCWDSNLGCPSPLKGRLRDLVLVVTVLTSFWDVPVSNLGRYTRFSADTFVWGGVGGLGGVGCSAVPQVSSRNLINPASVPDCPQFVSHRST